jgi:hypothetical protein
MDSLGSIKVSERILSMSLLQQVPLPVEAGFELWSFQADSSLCDSSCKPNGPGSELVDYCSW